MRKLLIFLLLVSSTVFGQASFERGNELYRQEKFSEASKVYESVLATGKHSPELYFNLGNAYYKLNEVAPAIYNYEKALLLDPDDAEVKNNLQFAQKMMIDEVREVPVVGFGKIIRSFTSIAHHDSWAWIAVGCAFSFLLLFAGYYFSWSAKSKRIFFFSMLFALIILGTAVFAAVFSKESQRAERPAIVFAGITSVKSEPQATGSDVATIHEGTKVYVLEKLEDWNRVQLPDGSDGWIKKQDIRELKP